MQIPRHIAFIMDGNGRWATKQGLPRSAGHKAGYEHIPDVLEICHALGVKVVSGYVWSTENWGRPKKESDFIIKAIERHLPRFVKNLHARNMRFVHSGFQDNLTPKVQKRFKDAVSLTCNNDGGIFNMAYNYGGRAEIIHATKQILSKNRANNTLSEKELESHLFTAGLPDVDLVIRTGGDQRLSNFLLWQSAFASIFVVDHYWPDIDEADIEAGIRQFNRTLEKVG